MHYDKLIKKVSPSCLYKGHILLSPGLSKGQRLRKF